jgi:hypothetical protein
MGELQTAIFGGLYPHQITLGEHADPSVIENLQRSCALQVGKQVLTELSKDADSLSKFCKELSRIGREFTRRAAIQPLSEEEKGKFFSEFGFPPSLEEMENTRRRHKSEKKRNQALRTLIQRREVCFNALKVLALGRQAVHPIHALVVILSRKAKTDFADVASRERLDSRLSMAETDGLYTLRPERFRKLEMTPTTGVLEVFLRDTEPADFSASKLRKRVQFFVQNSSGHHDLSDIKKAAKIMKVPLILGRPGRPRRPKSGA